MATLRLQYVQCLEETDEVGWDNPYLILFMANAFQDARVYRVRPGLPFFSGLGWAISRTWSDVATNALIFVAVMEQDGGLDMSNESRFTALTYALQGSYQSLKNMGLGTEALAPLMQLQMRSWLAYYRVNDDVVGVERIHAKLGGMEFGPDRPIVGDGGVYWMGFTMTNK